MKLPLKAVFLIVFILAVMLTWFVPGIKKQAEIQRLRSIVRQHEAITQLMLEVEGDPTPDPETYRRLLKLKEKYHWAMTPEEKEYLRSH